jgi:hypothetical protein
MPVVSEAKEAVLADNLNLGMKTGSEILDIPRRGHANDEEGGFFTEKTAQKEMEKEPEPEMEEREQETSPMDVEEKTDSHMGTRTVIIFDWDDTLLASSYLSAKGYRLDSSLEADTELKAELRELEQCICKVVTMALQHGEVHIVTNAEHGWVQLSAEKFIPAVLPLLNQVTVLSARSTFEPSYPEAPLKWKLCAFQHKLKVSECKLPKNVISFGDSHVEREAVQHATRGLSNTKTKSIKFAERPSMEQLKKQLELVTNCFQYILTHDGDLDLMLTISVGM